MTSATDLADCSAAERLALYRARRTPPVEATRAVPARIERFGLLVTPSVSVPAFVARPAGHSAMDAAAMLGWTPFSDPFNLTQQPNCTIPCGLSADSMPIGRQIVGPMFGDVLVLRAARAYEAMKPIANPELAALRPAAQ